MANNTTASVPQYAVGLGAPLPGQLFGTTQHVVLTKRANEEVYFGQALYLVDGDGASVGAYSAENAEFAGVAGFLHNVAGCYPEGKPVNCVTKGFIYVVASVDLAEGDKVYVTEGEFTNVAAGGTLVGQVVSAAAANGVAGILLG